MTTKASEKPAPIIPEPREVAVIPTPVTVGFGAEDLQKLEHDVLMWKRVKTVLIKLTREKDWSKWGASYWLEESGAEVVKNALGIGWSGLTVSNPLWREDEKGRYYVIEAKALFACPRFGVMAEFIGTCSSRDRFFAEHTVDGKKVLRPLSEIDETDLRKKSVTNLVVNGITRMAGLRNVDADELRTAGLEVGKIKVVEFGGRADVTASAETKSLADWTWDMCLKLSGDDVAKAETLCETVSGFKDKQTGKTVKGKRRPHNLTEKWLQNVHRRIKEQFEAAFPGGHPETPAPMREPGDDTPPISPFLSRMADYRTLLGETQYTAILTVFDYAKTEDIPEADQEAMLGSMAQAAKTKGKATP